MARPRLLLLVLLALASASAGCRQCAPERVLGTNRGEWFAPCAEGGTCAQGAACMEAGAVDRRGMACVAGSMCSAWCKTNEECQLASGDPEAFCMIADGVCGPRYLLGCRRQRRVEGEEDPGAGAGKLQPYGRE